METLNIEKEKAINAYQHGSEEQKKVLEQLFGKETFRQLMVTDRIKTFNDALIELGPNHPFGQRVRGYSQGRQYAKLNKLFKVAYCYGGT